MDKNQQFISIIVLSYNSARTIRETLDSILLQTRRNFEVIVSDDASSDDTLSCVNAWIEEHPMIDFPIKVVTATKNNGIPANCNRALAKARGQWIKLIAADDLLLPNCIQDNITFVEENPLVKIVQSRCVLFRTDYKQEPIAIEPSSEKEIFFNIGSAEEQYHFLLNKGNYIYAPSIFIKKEVIDDVGGFDERFPLMEDYPLWLNALRKGYTFKFLPKTTVAYRQHNLSVIKNSQPFMSEKFARHSIYFLQNYFTGAEVNTRVRKEILKYKAVVGLNRLGLNRRGLLPKILFALIFKF